MTQVGLDAAANAILGAQTMLPFAMRSYGGGAQEARQNGADLRQASLYGAAQAAKEVFTERMFNLSAPFAKAYGGGSMDDAVEKVIAKAVDKWAETEAGKRLLGGVLTYGAGALSEGLEELIGDWMEWQMPRIYGGDVDTAAETLSKSLYDFAVGALSGAIGGAVDSETYHYEAPGRSAATSWGAQSADRAINGTDAAETMRNATEARYLPKAEDLTPAQSAGVEAQKNAPEGAGLRYRFIDGGDAAGKDAAVNEAYERVSSRDGGVVISDELLAKYDAINKNPAMKLIDAVKDFYEEHLKGQKVDVRLNDGVIEVKFENDGKKKSVGWRMKTDKAASFEQLLDLTRNAEYAYSEVNRDTNEATSVPRFHYFIGDALIGAHVAEDGSTVGGVHMPVKIQVRDIITDVGAQESRYYTHNLEKSKAGSDSPVAGAKGTNIDSNAYTPALTKDSISQPSNAVKSSDDPLYLGSDSPAVMEDAARMRAAQAAQNVSEARYLPKAEEIAGSDEYSLGGSFDELVSRTQKGNVPGQDTGPLNFA